MVDLNSFQEKLENLQPNASAKDLARHMVVAALETEFGKSFTLTPGFAKMVNTLADAVVTNPDLRRQALAVASQQIEKNSGQTNIQKRD